MLFPAGASTQPRWYAAHVRVNQEKHVASHLNARQVEYFLPTYESMHQWKDRKKSLSQPLFPGYLFVHIDLSHSLKVLSVPNVVSLVGNRQAPMPVPANEIEGLRSGVHWKRIEPAPNGSVGQQVRICSGPFAGMEGVLIGTKNKRVVLSIQSIARPFAVDIGADEIHLLGPPATVSMA
jgi:transcription antitermination factor NusG